VLDRGDSFSWKKNDSHLQLRFVKLGLRVSYGALQHLSDLMMLVAFNLVQVEDSPASSR
jgi:hypothetical protein